MTKKRELMFSIVRGLLAILIALLVATLLIFISANGESVSEKLSSTGDALKQMLVGPLFRMGKKVLIRMPLIPGLNDDPAGLEAAFAMLREEAVQGADIAGVELLPYHRLGKNKYALLGRTYALESLGPMSKEDLARRAAFVAERLGGTKVLF